MVDLPVHQKNDEVEALTLAVPLLRPSGKCRQDHLWFAPGILESPGLALSFAVPSVRRLLAENNAGGSGSKAKGLRGGGGDLVGGSCQGEGSECWRKKTNRVMKLPSVSFHRRLDTSFPNEKSSLHIVYKNLLGGGGWGGKQRTRRVRVEKFFQSLSLHLRT